MEADGPQLTTGSRDEHDDEKHDDRKASQLARLSVCYAEIKLAEAELKFANTHLKYAQRQYQAVVDDMDDPPPELTDKPRAKRAKSSRGRGSKAKTTPHVTTTTATTSKEDAHTDDV